MEESKAAASIQCPTVGLTWTFPPQLLWPTAAEVSWGTRRTPRRGRSLKRQTWWGPCDCVCRARQTQSSWAHYPWRWGVCRWRGSPSGRSRPAVLGNAGSPACQGTWGCGWCAGCCECGCRQENKNSSDCCKIVHCLCWVFLCKWKKIHHSRVEVSKPLFPVWGFLDFPRSLIGQLDSVEVQHEHVGLEKIILCSAASEKTLEEKGRASVRMWECAAAFGTGHLFFSFVCFLYLDFLFCQGSSLAVHPGFLQGEQPWRGRRISMKPTKLIPGYRRNVPTE